MHVVREGMTKGCESGQNFVGDEREGGIRMTARLQASVIRGSFGCKEHCIGGFPGGAVVENPPANAGDMGSSPGPGRSHMPRSN